MELDSLFFVFSMENGMEKPFTDYDRKWRKDAQRKKQVLNYRIGN